MAAVVLALTQLPGCSRAPGCCKKGVPRPPAATCPTSQRQASGAGWAAGAAARGWGRLPRAGCAWGCSGAAGSRLAARQATLTRCLAVTLIRVGGTEVSSGDGSLPLTSQSEGQRSLRGGSCAGGRSAGDTGGGAGPGSAPPGRALVARAGDPQPLPLAEGTAELLGSVCAGGSVRNHFPAPRSCRAHGAGVADARGVAGLPCTCPPPPRVQP